MKITEELVADELEDFYDDVNNSDRKLRYLLKWPSTLDISADTPKMTFSPPKKKFKPKVKRPTTLSKHGRRGRSSTF
jgi:hypothetical protein